MDNSAQRPSYQQVKAMIKQFTGQANTLVIPRVFIDFTGDHLAALLLSQILYWSDRTDDADGWFYKTAEEWEAELGLSNFQVKRAAQLLNKFGIESKVRKVKTTPKMHYRIDMPLFVDLFLKFLESRETSNSTKYKLEIQETSKSMDFQETSKSYIGTEITTEITSREREPRAPAQPVSLHPALEVYTNLTGLRQPRFTIEMITSQVTDLAKWENTIKDWLASGYKPNNVKGMLDWYHGKGRYQQNGTAQANRQPSDLPLITAAPKPSPEEQRAAAARRKQILERSRAK
jgi:hypothetical protein